MARVPGPNNVVATIQQLGQNLEEITRKTLYSAVIGRGGIKIDSTGSIQVTNGAPGLGQFYIGGGSSANHHSDGSPQIITSIGDESGKDRLVLWDDSNPASPTNQRFYEYDVAGRLVRTQDKNGGWATPWFSVPMYPRFVPNGQPASYSSNGWGYGYASLSTSGNGVSSGMVIWEGRIPFVSHPRIAVDGVWGNASGSVAPTYSLLVAGSSVGSFTPSALTTQSWGPFDISSRLTNTAVQVQITVSYTGTGAFAADCLGVYLRQT